MAVAEALPVRRELPHLEPHEQQLYARLVKHAADHGTGLLLEQERICWTYAYQQLTHAISTMKFPFGRMPRRASPRQAAA